MPEWIAAPEDAGARLDAFLAGKMEKTRSSVQKLIEEENVRLNGAPVAKNARLREGDRVEATEPPPEVLDVKPQNIPLDIVYEDQDLLVVNKPKGMVVHPAAGNPDGTLVNALLFHCGDSLSGINGVIRPGIVHRIDKDTSGLLVVAKTPEAKTKLGLQFFNKTTRRRYNALVWGNFEEDEGRIEGNIARNPRDRMQMAVFDPQSGIGKHAVTHYRVLQRFGYVTLVECILETGRTHQIRVHMKHIGHPLFNDERYGGTQILRGTQSGNYQSFIRNCFEICPRQALHAKTLGFKHPKTEKEMDFTTELPEDMKQLIEKWDTFIKGCAAKPI